MSGKGKPSGPSREAPAYEVARSIGAEEDVIGAVLLHGLSYNDISDILEHDGSDFKNPVLGAIWAAMCSYVKRLDGRGAPGIDMMTVLDQMTAVGTAHLLKFHGDVIFLVDLANKVVRWDNIREHALIVRKQARYRKAHLLAGQQVRLAVPRLLSHDERMLANVVPSDDLVRQIDQENDIAVKLEQMRRPHRGHLVKHGHHVDPRRSTAIQTLDVGAHRRPDRPKNRVFEIAAIVFEDVRDVVVRQPVEQHGPDHVFLGPDGPRHLIGGGLSAWPRWLPLAAHSRGLTG